MKYTRGNVSTDREFNRPSIPAIVAWYDEIKLEAERSGYQAYLTGRSLTDINATMDVDVVFTGKMNIDAVEHLLISSVVTGFRHKLLIDARWQNKIETAEYKDGKITILPTEFVFLNYYEHDNGQGRKVINDYRLHPAFKAVNDNLVGSTYQQLAKKLKPHLEQYIMKHGKLAYLPLGATE
jgi:hypothetical protein